MSTLNFLRRWLKHSAIMATAIVVVLIMIYGYNDAGAERMAILVCVLLAAHIVVAGTILVMARRSSHEVSTQ